MSFFGVTIEQIKSIDSIKGADFIDSATLENLGFIFVVKKGQFKVGDRVLYFPVDSVLEDPDLIEKMGLTGKLSGGQKNRVKTVKLKNVYSQGIVGDLSLIDDLNVDPTTEEITNFLKVSKYDPPETKVNNANASSLKLGQSKYDIEGCQYHPELVEELMNKKVVVMEKVEGSNWSLSYNAKLNEFYVNSRTRELRPRKPDGEVFDSNKEAYNFIRENLKDKNITDNINSYWHMAAKYDVLSFAKKVAEQFNLKDSGETLIVYAELIGPGIQKNLYKLSKHELRFFDIKIEKRFIDYYDFEKLINDFNDENDIIFPIQIVPVLDQNKTLKEILNGRSFMEYAHGQSILNKNILREGVVAKPCTELYNTERYRHGRIIVKHRDPKYLAKYFGGKDD